MTREHPRLRVLTLNVHKGFSALGRRFVLHELKEAIAAEELDLVFLQEVIGENLRHAETIPHWPAQSQYEFLADSIWSDYAYGKNSVYSSGHHGNAILSRFPILASQKVDISASRFEQRGFLHASILHPAVDAPLHVLCVHFGLFRSWRRHQFRLLREFLGDTVPPESSLLIAGDFNDWSKEADQYLVQPCQLVDSYASLHGHSAKTFPALYPLLSMDRIDLRSLKAHHAEVLTHGNWKRLSDHAPLRIEVELRGKS